jgi:hypothetical protein
MILYALVIFLGALLLFQVEPLIVKIILPWFGGSAGVWSAALLFFQLLLLGGYTYAHLLVRLAKARAQMAVHVVLLAASCAMLPIMPSPSWKPAVAGDPTLRILGALLVTIGLPYFLLSATSPLLQAWYVRRTGSGMPYRFFALSNFGSLLGLLSFPLLVEPRLTSRQQVYAWSGMYGLFALVCARTAWTRRAPTSSPTEASIEAPAPAAPVVRLEFAQRLLWVALAGCPSVLLLAITNHLSQNLAPIPLLWIIPLATYLATFILAFESDRIYQRWIVLPCLGLALAAMDYLIWQDPGDVKLGRLIVIFIMGLFFCCLMCHGELARRKPPTQHLTLFYLLVSLGGTLGGVFVALIAPHVFRTYLELPLGLFVCGVLAIIVLWNAVIPRLAAWPLRAALVLGVCLLGASMWRQEETWRLHSLLIERNFYGVLLVQEDPDDDPPDRQLVHGTVINGAQMLQPDLRFEPCTYYGRTSGVGRAIAAMEDQGPLRVGVIGLGAGTLLAYGRPRDVYRIFEINPLVEKIARSEFSFYQHCPADKQVLMGDARLTLEHLESQQFDLLAVDAFSSDAIPVHLLTREALALYFRHLKHDGILALHISNLYLNLELVCARGAQAFGTQTLVVNDKPSDDSFLYESSWVLLTYNPAWFKNRSFTGVTPQPAAAPRGFRGWTDDYSSVFRIFKLRGTER